MGILGRGRIPQICCGLDCPWLPGRAGKDELGPLQLPQLEPVGGDLGEVVLGLLQEPAFRAADRIIVERNVTQVKAIRTIAEAGSWALHLHLDRLFA
jgi:hypothetical protein